MSAAAEPVGKGARSRPPSLLLMLAESRAFGEFGAQVASAPLCRGDPGDRRQARRPREIFAVLAQRPVCMRLWPTRTQTA